MKPVSRVVFSLVLGATTAGFAQVTSAQTPSPDKLVDALEGVFGKHAARRSGAKGVCATGFFVGSPEGRKLTPSAIFNGQEIPVIARFSIGGGNPKASDKARSVRGLALKLTEPGGESWQMSNISAPVFFVNSPESFVQFLEARRPDPATGRPDAAKVKAYNDSHPDAKPQIDWLAKAPVPASYATVNYWGTNAFTFTSPTGKKVFGKWMFAPARGQQGLSEDELKQLPDDFLADELRKRAAKTSIVFDFKIQIAEPGDVVNDATVPLPANRKVVTAGRLVIDKVEAGPGGACDRVVYNPVVLPKGIGLSDDPTLTARPAAYAISFSRRLSE